MLYNPDCEKELALHEEDTSVEWASQEDVDCPHCAHRYYICICNHEQLCDCYKCQNGTH